MVEFEEYENHLVAEGRHLRENNINDRHQCQGDQLSRYSRVERKISEEPKAEMEPESSKCH